MKFEKLVFPFLVLSFVFCNMLSAEQRITRINADSLITNIEKYRDTEVEIEGIIIHVCGVNWDKLKLETENGAIIKIVSRDTLHHFDKSLYKKKIKVKGIVKEERLDNYYVNKMEEEKTLLCHIDHSPCKDSAWVDRQITNGTADDISIQDIKELRTEMEQTQKRYISVITILAENYEIVE